MEVVAKNDSPIRIRPGHSHEIGREQGVVDSSDKTISRHHLLLSVAADMNGDDEFRLQFEVLGRNPIYIYRDNQVKIFRKFERGEMENGDMFSVSGKNPVWYSVRRIEDDTDIIRRNDPESGTDGAMESDFGLDGVENLDPEGVDISGLDPVKEFGFLVEGHEFDTYPKIMIRDIKNWDWFLEENRKKSEDDDDDDDDEVEKVKARRAGKRKKGAKNNDGDEEEWTGEIESHGVLMNESRKAPRVKYTTRSKNHGKQSKMSSTRKKKRGGDEKDEDVRHEEEDEDDTTLGGFIVDDKNLDEDEEEGESEQEEEEDFEDEDE